MQIRVKVGEPPAWANTGIDHEVLAELGWELAGLWDKRQEQTWTDSRDFVGLIINAALAFQNAYRDEDWGDRGDYIEQILMWAQQVEKHVLENGWGLPECRVREVI